MKPVYKYVHSERLEFLQTGRIRFTQPHLLNDPFEALPNVHKGRLAYQEELLSGVPPQEQAILSKFLIASAPTSMLWARKDIGKHFAILSLSEQRNHMLMWSHYADAHRGYVLGFDSDHDWFKPRTGFSRYGLAKVNYNPIRIDVPPDFSNLDFHEMDRIYQSVLLTKSPCWDYELEWRMIISPLAVVIEPEYKNGEHVYLVDVPRDCVTEIICGALMPTAERLKIKELQESNFPRAILFGAELSESEFGANINPMPDYYEMAVTQRSFDEALRRNHLKY